MTILKTARILAISTIILLSTNFVQAQQGPPPTPNSSQIKKMVTELSNTLELDADQSKEVFDLYTSHYKEVKTKTESGRPSRKVMENLQTKFEKEVKSLLNEEQQEEFDAFVKKNKPQKGRQQRR